ncbi:MAG: HD domain-containing protein [Gemmatimonadaceae bacterium]
MRRFLTALFTVAASTAALQAQAPAPWREKVAALMAASMQHTAWGVSHGERDYHLALEIARRDQLPVDDDVLFAAAMLHDIAAFPPWAKAGVDHGDRAAEVLPDSLRAWGFPEAKIARVQQAVSHHMYYHTLGDGAEAAVLRDADTLDFLGWEGITRVLSLSTRHRWATDLATAVATIRRNADELPPTLSTRAGKAMAEPRVAAMHTYLAGLDGELKGIGAP